MPIEHLTVHEVTPVDGAPDSLPPEHLHRVDSARARDEGSGRGDDRRAHEAATAAKLIGSSTGRTQRKQASRRRRKGTTRLSPTEAAFVAELPRKTVEQAIDRGEVKPLRADRGERARALDEAAVVYLRIRGDVGDLLTAKARREVYRALRRAEPVRSRLELGPIAVSTTEAVRTVRERMGRLRRARSAVEIDPEVRGGEPVVRGTRIPVYMLADLEKAGEPRDRILEDYPAIDAELLEDALLYASLNPRRGRPRTAPGRERKARRTFRADKLRGER